MRHQIYVSRRCLVNKGAIKNGQSRETGNTGQTRRRKTKQKHNTICGGHHNANTTNVHVNKA